MAEQPDARLAGFFIAKNVDMKCQSCGKEEWRSFGEVVRMTLKRGLTGIVEPSIPALGLACTNCGFTRLYVKQVYDDWLAAQGEK